jgi:hypothetical protein
MCDQMVKCWICHKTMTEDNPYQNGECVYCAECLKTDPDLTICDMCGSSVYNLHSRKIGSFVFCCNCQIELDK